MNGVLHWSVPNIYVGKVSEFTKEEFLNQCFCEFHYIFEMSESIDKEYKRPTIEDIKEKLCRYYPKGWEEDPEQGFYSIENFKNKRGVFKVWTIEL